MAQERVLAERTDPALGREYLVRWEGYGSEHDTWETASRIEDEDLIRDFNATGCVDFASDKSKICGTFGCTLPDKHSGLHSIPDLGRRERKRKEPEEPPQTFAGSAARKAKPPEAPKAPSEGSTSSEQPVAEEQCEAIVLDAEEVQCERDWRCVRGPRHGGHCSLKKTLPTGPLPPPPHQCERDPNCTRGPRHGGHCSVKKGAASSDPSTNKQQSTKTQTKTSLPQCERDPQCVRGPRHGGRCSLKSDEERAAVETQPWQCQKDPRCIRGPRHGGMCSLRKEPAAQPASQQQCERDPGCIRGPKHGGHCSLRKEPEEDEDPLVCERNDWCVRGRRHGGHCSANASLKPPQHKQATEKPPICRPFAGAGGSAWTDAAPPPSQTDGTDSAVPAATTARPQTLDPPLLSTSPARAVASGGYKSEVPIGPEHQAELPQYLGPLAAAHPTAPTAATGGRRTQNAAAKRPDPCMPAATKRPEPTHVPTMRIEVELAKTIAATLTAAAYSDDSPWLFVAPAGRGLGLFARQRLRAGQALGEFGGPQLPLHLLDARKREHVLEVPGGGREGRLFIDGNWEHSIAAGAGAAPAGRPPTIFAQCCSSAPNGRFEAWPVLDAEAQAFRKEMWLVAAEDIDEGQEIRVDYAECGTHCRGAELEDDDWRERRARPPGGGGYAPVLSQQRRLQRTEQLYTKGYSSIHLSTAAEKGGYNGPGAHRLGAALGGGGGDGWTSDTDHLTALRSSGGGRSIGGGRRSGGGGSSSREAEWDDAEAVLLERLVEQLGESSWPVVCTHLPGRTAEQCRRHWRTLRQRGDEEDDGGEEGGGGSGEEDAAGGESDDADDDGEEDGDDAVVDVRLGLSVARGGRVRCALHLEGTAPVVAPRLPRFNKFRLNDPSSFKLCGTFGCILPDRHPGLHVIPTDGATRKRRAPTMMEDEELPGYYREGSRGVAAKQRRADEQLASQPPPQHHQQQPPFHSQPPQRNGSGSGGGGAARPKKEKDAKGSKPKQWLTVPPRLGDPAWNEHSTDDNPCAYCRSKGKAHRACLRLPTCVSICATPVSQRHGRQWLDGIIGGVGERRPGSAKRERDAKPEKESVFIVDRLLDQRWVDTNGKRLPGSHGDGASSDDPPPAGARREYLVRWEGFPPSHDTWEDEANILDADLIERFNAVEAKRRAMQARRAKIEDALEARRGRGATANGGADSSGPGDGDHEDATASGDGTVALPAGTEAPLPIADPSDKRLADDV